MQRDNYSSTKERRKDKSNNKAGQNEERGQKNIFIIGFHGKRFTILAKIQKNLEDITHLADGLP